MRQNQIVTVILVLIAAAIAWFLVGFLLQALALLIRLALMALIAVGVFVVLKAVLSGSDR